MVNQVLEQALIDERQAEVDRIQLERQTQTDGLEAASEIRFLTTAARILVAVISEPGATMREIAQRCGKTERAVWQQLQKLERAGFIRRHRVGRRSQYEVDKSALDRQLLVESALLLRGGWFERGVASPAP